ncbi:hypothetical protein ACCS64_39455, partial [Rhizobium ruizarguesonis]
LTRNISPAELSRSALEAVCYQTRDLLDAMQKDCKNGTEDTVLRVSPKIAPRALASQCGAPSPVKEGTR